MVVRASRLVFTILKKKKKKKKKKLANLDGIGCCTILNIREMFEMRVYIYIYIFFEQGWNFH